MRLAVAAVGKVRSGPDRELAERYRDRAAKAGRSLGISAVDIFELAESRAPRAADRLSEEGVAFRKILPAGAVRIVLDAAGTPLTSEHFAARIGAWRDQGCEALFFMIGGADGLAPDLPQRAGLVLSFGKATWPHQLVRIMLLEQLYRAVTIMAGHPYHRA